MTVSLHAPEHDAPTGQADEANGEPDRQAEACSGDTPPRKTGEIVQLLLSCQ
jgi:hypothetical protein